VSGSGPCVVALTDVRSRPPPYSAAADAAAKIGRSMSALKSEASSEVDPSNTKAR